MLRAPIFLVALLAAGIALSAQDSAPRLEFSSLVYQGAFRVPAGPANDEYFGFGGSGVAFNPAKGSLFVSSYKGKVAEISIPAPVKSAALTELPVASYVQGFADPFEGKVIEGAGLTGLLVVGDRLHAAMSIYYDANNTQRVSHLSRPVNLSERSASNWSQVWQADKQGFVSGYFAGVPSAWQAALGGEVLVGQCCIPIVTRTSLGPSAFAIHPAQIGEAKVPATPLLYYDSEHAKLGPWEGSNPTYGATTMMGGMAAIAGTRTLLYIGSNGLGPHCYGNGTGDKALDHTLGADHEKYCYDPTSTSKSSHAYPYRFQIWAYDLNDLAAVKAGRKKPWDVMPYGVWPFELPTVGKITRVGGVGYDAEHQRIYFAQVQADEPGGFLPIIHVFEVKGAASPVR